MVVLYLAAANRDPDAYDDPNRFNLTPAGQGRAPGLLRRHPLLPRGAPRARVEATVALQRLVQRFPRLQRAGRG
jgi:cytochrome P450